MFLAASLLGTFSAWWVAGAVLALAWITLAVADLAAFACLALAGGTGAVLAFAYIAFAGGTAFTSRFAFAVDAGAVLALARATLAHVAAFTSGSTQGVSHRRTHFHGEAERGKTKQDTED